jgi:hypothetical protein
MTIKAILLRAVAFLAGHAPGNVLGELRQRATADFDAAVNKAHDARVTAEKEIGRLATAELDKVEALIDSAARRAASLIASGTVPEAHAARLTAFQAPPVK